MAIKKEKFAEPNSIIQNEIANRPKRRRFSLTHPALQ